ncbi:MAG: flap endonuclease-1 [archaeon GW2011_AR4]|nr:MAG: flap endonuclease-1 [archaeon GW2011_AR4]
MSARECLSKTSTMGIQLTELVTTTPLELESLQGKVIVIDSNNLLYQFLASIRQPDGSLLTDKKGQVTSHLAGLLSRTTRLLSYGMKLVFVFDGKPPELKMQELVRRASLKKEALSQYHEAVRAEDIEEMKKYASRTSRITPEIKAESEQMMRAFGCPVIHAPSEGEAQAAFMVIRGDAYAEVSQDYDCLLFGVPRMIKNLTFAGKKKMKDKLSLVPVQPEMITLSSVLNGLGISREQLIALGMLIGTDFNPGGIKGIGPKNALKLVKEHGEDFDRLFSSVPWGDYCTAPWREVFDLFMHMPVRDDYALRFGTPDFFALKKLLIEDHDFSEERVDSSLSSLQKTLKEKKQQGLGAWMK